MTDNLTKTQRHFCMSNIHSKWTVQELKLHNYLKGNKIKHQMQPKLKGNPDILLTKSKTAIFLHGCFWHKCPKCYTTPKTNKKYWIPKLENNVKRDRKNIKILKAQGILSLKIWEHQIKAEFRHHLNKVIENEKWLARN